MVVVMMLRMVVYAPIIGIGGVVKVLRTRTGMGWIIVVAVAMILALVGILMVVAMPKFKKMQTLVDRLNLVSREILTGVPVIRAFSREKFEEERFDRANRDLMRTQLFTNRVMNIMMPVMSGEKAMMELQKIDGFKTPVIALTADAVARAEEKYVRIGFTDYIAKPFSKEQIKRKLDQIFSNEKF